MTNVCDFCSEPSPVWSFDCATYKVPEAAYESLGPWLACETCADLIHRECWRELGERACAKTETGKLLQSIAGKTEALNAIDEMHRGFRSHATGRSFRLEER